MKQIFFAWILLALIFAASGSPLDDDCVGLVEDFLQKRLPNLRERSKEVQEYKEDDFVYFLHIPRTAGRSFWSCFLHRAFPTSKRCAKSYDTLRLELSRPDCKLLASHDDYSVTDFLPENFKVITQVRHPVDRVISAYEFSTLIAAKEYSINTTKPDVQPKKAKEGEEKVLTRDVWPWLYLVQLFDRYSEKTLTHIYRKHKEYRESKSPNLFCVWRHMLGPENPTEHEKSLDRWIQAFSAKSGKLYYYHRKTRESKWELDDEEKKKLTPLLDPYNNTIYLPLALFVQFPMADELVNNAMTYQVNLFGSLDTKLRQFERRFWD